MAEFQFKKNEFLSFRATTKFHLGEKQRDIWGGDEIEFDGSTVKHQGDQFGAPSIRGAIKAGWLVPVTDNVSQYIPKAAGVVVHKAAATGKERGSPIQMGATQDEEHEVGKVGQHSERVKTALANSVEPKVRPVVQPDPVQDDLRESLQELLGDTEEAPSEGEGIDDASSEGEVTEAPSSLRRGVEEADATNRAILAKALATEVPKPKDQTLAYGGGRHNTLGEEKPSKDGKKFAVKTSVDTQEGQVVSKIKTSAPGVSVGSEGARGAAKAMDVSKVSSKDIEASVKPIGGGKRPLLPTSELKAKIISSGGMAVTGAVTMPEKTPEEKDFEHKIPKGTVTQVTQGQSLSDKSGGATGDVKVTASGDELTDLLPDAIVAGAKPAGSISGQDPQGFSWDKSLHWTTRVDLAVRNYGNDPDIIKQILAVESPSVSKQIQTKLAQKAT